MHISTAKAMRVWIRFTGHRASACEMGARVRMDVARNSDRSRALAHKIYGFFAHEMAQWQAA